MPRLRQNELKRDQIDTNGSRFGRGKRNSRTKCHVYLFKGKFSFSDNNKTLPSGKKTGRAQAEYEEEKARHATLRSRLDLMPPEVVPHFPEQTDFAQGKGGGPCLSRVERNAPHRARPLGLRRPSKRASPFFGGYPSSNRTCSFPAYGSPCGTGENNNVERLQ